MSSSAQALDKAMVKDLRRLWRAGRVLDRYQTFTVRRLAGDLLGDLGIDGAAAEAVVAQLLRRCEEPSLRGSKGIEDDFRDLLVRVEARAVPEEEALRAFATGERIGLAEHRALAAWAQRQLEEWAAERLRAGSASARQEVAEEWEGVLARWRGRLERRMKGPGDPLGAREALDKIVWSVRREQRGRRAGGRERLGENPVVDPAPGKHSQDDGETDVADIDPSRVASAVRYLGKRIHQQSRWLGELLAPMATYVARGEEPKAGLPVLQALAMLRLRERYWPPSALPAVVAFGTARAGSPLQPESVARQFRRWGKIVRERLARTDEGRLARALLAPSAVDWWKLDRLLDGPAGPVSAPGLDLGSVTAGLASAWKAGVGVLVAVLAVGLSLRGCDEPPKPPEGPPMAEARPPPPAPGPVEVPAPPSPQPPAPSPRLAESAPETAPPAAQAAQPPAQAPEAAAPRAPLRPKRMRIANAAYPIDWIGVRPEEYPSSLVVYGDGEKTFGLDLYTTREGCQEEWGDRVGKECVALPLRGQAEVSLADFSLSCARTEFLVGQPPTLKPHCVLLNKGESIALLRDRTGGPTHVIGVAEFRHVEVLYGNRRWTGQPERVGFVLEHWNDQWSSALLMLPGEVPKVGYSAWAFVGLDDAGPSPSTDPPVASFTVRIDIYAFDGQLVGPVEARVEAVPVELVQPTR